MHWYNHDHKHSKIRFVTPQQRHSGQDAQILQQRKAVLEQAKLAKPSRWGSRPTRNCESIGAVCLNPERDDQIISADKQAA